MEYGIQCILGSMFGFMRITLKENPSIMGINYLPKIHTLYGHAQASNLSSTKINALFKIF